MKADSLSTIRSAKVSHKKSSFLIPIKQKPLLNLQDLQDKLREVILNFLKEIIHFLEIVGLGIKKNLIIRKT